MTHVTVTVCRLCDQPLTADENMVFGWRGETGICPGSARMAALHEPVEVDMDLHDTEAVARWIET